MDTSPIEERFVCAHADTHTHTPTSKRPWYYHFVSMESKENGSLDGSTQGLLCKQKDLKEANIWKWLKKP